MGFNGTSTCGNSEAANCDSHPSLHACTTPALLLLAAASASSRVETCPCETAEGSPGSDKDDGVTQWLRRR